MGDVLYIEDLYQAGPETIIALLRQLPDDIDTAMIIGHNPGLDNFLEMVCVEYEHIPTGCVAYITFPLARWVDLREGTTGNLFRFWKVREI